MSTTTCSAPDIVCGGCANAIKKALGALPGVSRVEVNVGSKHVAGTHDAATAPPATLAATLDRAGFPATALPEPKAGNVVSPEGPSCSCCK